MLSKSRTAAATSAQAHIALNETYGAHNYHPLPVVVARGEGVWVTDTDGKKYMDMLAAYSALNFGHCHPALIAAAKEQLDNVTLTSRAFYNEQLGPFCVELAALCDKQAVLPMNTGAEAVETAIKTARKWGYERKGVAPERAKIICCHENFHGRTTTIISFSTDAQARKGFGPYTPGFELIPFGDATALEKAIDVNTVGFLFEPIQGEAGVVVPPAGWLRQVRDICTRHSILMLADEVQSGLGRTGHTFACDAEGVVPDMYILGKALGGGVVPVSAIAADRQIMDVFKPGDHGSTFGGNPLACAVARKVIAMLQEGSYQANAKTLGAHLFKRIEEATLAPVVESIRGRGLWMGIVVNAKIGPARPYCERLMQRGVLCKETHKQVIRLAPPLSIHKDELDWAIDHVIAVLREH